MAAAGALLLALLGGQAGALATSPGTSSSAALRTGPDSAESATTCGVERWKVKTPGGATAGTIVVDGKVLSGRACGNAGTACFVLALDAKTGKELWKFYTVAQD